MPRSASQIRISINVDREWWAKVCAYAKEIDHHPSTVLKQGADELLVNAGVLPHGSPSRVLWRNRLSNQRKRS